MGFGHKYFSEEKSRYPDSCRRTPSFKSHRAVFSLRSKIAEEVGFEPTIGFTLYRVSNAAPSTSQPLFLIFTLFKRKSLSRNVAFRLPPSLRSWIKSKQFAFIALSHSSFIKTVSLFCLFHKKCYSILCIWLVLILDTYVPTETSVRRQILAPIY